VIFPKSPHEVSLPFLNSKAPWVLFGSCQWSFYYSRPPHCKYPLLRNGVLLLFISIFAFFLSLCRLSIETSLEPSAASSARAITIFSWGSSTTKEALGSTSSRSSELDLSLKVYLFAAETSIAPSPDWLGMCAGRQIRSEVDEEDGGYWNRRNFDSWIKLYPWSFVIIYKDMASEN
jgi:hypothetical protein